MQPLSVREAGPVPEHWLYWTLVRPSLLRTPLRCADGRTVAFLDLPDPARGSGPDFRNVLLSLDGVRCRGDVECHVTPGDWHRHGHDGDRRYDGVILHVLWTAPAGIPGDLAARFPHLLLSEHLAVAETAWRAHMMRLDRESPPRGTGACPDFLDATDLAGLAERRFERRVTRLRSWLPDLGPEGIAWVALAEALGYCANRAPFASLMRRLWSVDRTPDARQPVPLWWFLAHQAGWLERPGAAVSGDAARFWRERYRSAGWVPWLRHTDWEFAGLRPANRPERRLAGLVELLYRHGDRLFPVLMAGLEGRQSLTAVIPRLEALLRPRLSSGLLTALSGFAPGQARPGRVMGRERFLQYLVNGVLPMAALWADCRGNEGFRAYLAGLYEGLPATEHSAVVARGVRSLSDPALVAAVRRGGFWQQGLLEALGSTQKEKPVATRSGPT